MSHTTHMELTRACVEDLRAALEQFEAIYADLAGNGNGGEESNINVSEDSG